MSMNPDTVTLITLQDQILQAKTWLHAAEATLRTLVAKRAPTQVTDSPSAAPTATVNIAQAVRAKRRFKSEILKDGILEGIPQAALEHPALLGPKGQRPTHLGLDQAEKLIKDVKAYKAEGKDPASLWTAYTA